MNELKWPNFIFYSYSKKVEVNVTVKRDQRIEGFSKQMEQQTILL